MSPYDSLINQGAQETSNSFLKGGWLSSLCHSDKPDTLSSPGLHCHQNTRTEGRTGDKLYLLQEPKQKLEKSITLIHTWRGLLCGTSPGIAAAGCQRLCTSGGGERLHLPAAGPPAASQWWPSSLCSSTSLEAPVKKTWECSHLCWSPLPYSQRLDTTLGFHPWGRAPRDGLAPFLIVHHPTLPQLTSLVFFSLHGHLLYTQHDP